LLEKYCYEYLDWNSALFMILAGSKEDHLNMLDGGIIQRLLEEKWKTFAQRQFLKRITIAFIHLLSMSFAVYFRTNDRTGSLLKYSDVTSLLRLGFEIATIMNCISYVVIQQGEEIKNQGLVSFIKQLVSLDSELMELSKWSLSIMPSCKHPPCHSFSLMLHRRQYSLLQILSSSLVFRFGLWEIFRPKRHS
jgi:hypothetical protein